MILRKAIADIVQGLFACLAGATVWIFFHWMWYFHWMDRLGDPPMSNPAYEAIRATFVSLSFAISALVVGLTAAFGSVRPWWRVMTRFLVGPVFAMLLLVFRLEDPLYTKWYIPVLLASFTVSLIIAAMYHRLAKWSHRSASTCTSEDL